MSAGFSEDYKQGFFAGYQAGIKDELHWASNPSLSPMPANPSPKRKRKQTGKAKVLTDMTRPIWNKYKKGSGKKTYFDIRSQVQRSQKYKKATKKM